MTAPDTSGRSDAATQGDGAQTWRVVLERASTGERVEVTPTVTRRAGETEERIAGCDLGWTAHGEAPFGDFRGYGLTPRAAVLDWLQGTWAWVPVEILAPGEPSRAELVAAHAAAIARAVAEEQARCIADCEAEAEGWATQERQDAARACVYAIQRRARGGAQ